MRCFIDLLEGTVSAEFPVKSGDYRQTLKALAGERVQLRWSNAGVAYELPADTEIKLVVRDAKGGTLLAELTSFTAPADVTTGFYEGRLTFNTDNVVALLAADPTKTTFTAVGEILWKIPAATEWEASDDLTLVLLKKVSVGDDEGDPLVLASGFAWLQDRLVAGTNVTLTVDAEAETISIASSGGGGGGGSGDVVGPASATDNAIVRFNATTGKLIQTSGITIADGASGTLSGTNTGDQTAASLGLVIGTNVQAYSANLATFAGIAPAANVQSLLSAADYSAIRTLLGLVIGTNVQAYNANLTTFAGIAPAANVQSLLSAADYSAIRTLLGLVIGTNVQAYSANLTTFAGIAPAANVQSLLSAADYSAIRTLLGLVIGTNVMAYSANLTTFAGITPSANVQSFLGAANYSAMRTAMGLAIGSDVMAYIAASAGGNAIADGGKLALYDPSGQLTGTGVRSNAGDSTSRYALLTDRILEFANVLGSGFSHSIFAGSPANHRVHTLPDRSGTLLHADGNGSALTGLTPYQLDQVSATNGQVLAWSNANSRWQPLTVSGTGDALVASTLDQFADVTQTAGKTLAITDNTTLAGGSHSGTNTGDNAVNSLYSGLVSNATHTGDATGDTALTLATVNANVGSFGSATSAVALTVNAKGLVTAASATTITPEGTSVKSTGETGGSKFLREDGDGTCSWQTVAGGLTNLTESLATASPNNTVNAAALAVTGGTTNADLVLSPKGTGALLAQIPDSTTTAGNKRGTYAVDWQIIRGAAADVASGIWSTISGGKHNKANAQYATVVGGYGNIASGENAVAGGWFSTASGASTVALGYQHTVAANYAAALGGIQHTASGAQSVVAGGYTNTSSGQESAVLGGLTNTASATHSVVIGGTQGKADRQGMVAHSAGMFAAQGDAQDVSFVLRTKTTTNAAVEMYLNGSSVRLTIPSGKVLHATVKIVGVKSDGTAVATYLRQVCIKNVAGTTALVGSVITLGTDEAAGTSVSITASDANDAMIISPTGITSETWRWVAVVEGVEVAYGT